MTHRWQRVGLAALSLAAVVGAGLPGVTIRDLRLPLGEAGHVEIGIARTALLDAAFAQVADTTLENVTVQLGAITYRLPRMEFSGVNYSRAELMAMFDAASSEPVGVRLARLSAREVRIPEVRIEQSFTSRTQVTVYRDVVARNVAGGRIAALTSTGATLDVSGDAAGPAKGTSGPLAINDLDLAYAVTLYTQKTGPGPAPVKTVYGSFSLDDLAISDPRSRISIARLWGKDFRARPAAESWSEAMRLLGEAQEPKASDRGRAIDVLADLFDSFEVASLEATGIGISTNDPGAWRIARIAFTGGTANRMAEAHAEGIELVSVGIGARIGMIAFTGFSLRDSLQSLKGFAEKPPKDVDVADLRRLLPATGTMRLSGLELEVANEKAGTPKPENSRFGVREVEIAADRPVNGVPTNLRVAVHNVTFAVPPNATEEGLKDLAALGYSHADLSFVTAASWNEPGNELVVREVSVRGADMGSATLRGVLANVGRDVFNPDSALALVALLGATARNLDLAVENKGLFERVIAREAKQQKKTPEDLRREYGMTAAVAVPAMLGNSGAAKALGQAVARFVARPGRLTISVRAKDPAGIDITDLVAAEPAALLEKIEITATAE